MVFQHNVSRELQQAILEPPPQSISPTIPNPKTGYQDALIRLSQENSKNYWTPFKYFNKLSDGRWECEITMGVFRSGGTVVHTRKVAAHILEDALEMAAASLYHDLLLDFIDIRKSSADVAPVAPPAGPQMGVWKIERLAKKMTKAEKGKLRKGEPSGEKQAKKQEVESEADLKRREKKLKSQQKVREMLLNRINVRERRLERKLESWNARIQKSKSAASMTDIPEDLEVTKVRSDLMDWRGKLEDFERVCEIEDTNHLALSGQKLTENVNLSDSDRSRDLDRNTKHNGISTIFSKRQPEMNPSNSSDPTQFNYHSNSTQSVSESQNIQSGTLTSLPMVNAGHFNPIQFSYNSNSTQSNPQTQNIQSGTITGLPMVNTGHFNPTSTILNSNSNQAMQSTWAAQSNVTTSLPTVNTGHFNTTPFNYHSNSTQSIPKTQNIQSSTIKTPPVINTGHFNPTQFSYHSNSTQSNPQIQNIQSGNLKSLSMVNTSPSSPTPTIFNNSSQASSSTWSTQSSPITSRPVVNTRHFSPTPKIFSNNSSQAISSPWAAQSSPITSHPIANLSNPQEPISAEVADIFSDHSGSNPHTAAYNNNTQAYYPVSTEDIAQNSEVCDLPLQCDAFTLPYKGTPALETPDEDLALFSSVFDDEMMLC